MADTLNIVIRRAGEADLGALGRLGALLLRVHYAFDNARFMKPDESVEDGYAWFLGTQLADPDVLVLLAERHGEIVGYLYAGIEPRNWKELRESAGFIHDVVVAESARSSGIATELMTAAFEWMRERGTPRVLLWTAAPNAHARRLFESVGFRTTMLEMTREL